ncbi:MAG: glycosyltransferase family 2 protein [Patescibacteria group bacterium]|nr:glycosyltransferase family 2 protein [Patescibacteria group bacterium]
MEIFKLKDDPKISVLMPAYNAEKYIGEAIESILNQTFTNFEFIIIDDCSTDKTWDIIQEYVKKNNKIRSFKNEKNLGIAGSRNKLLGLAGGKYIVWQDADDISMLDRLKHQFEFMEANKDVGICGGWLQFFSDKKEGSIRKYKQNDKDIRRTIFRYSPVAQPGAILRKEAVEFAGLYDLNYPPAEDLDMSFRIGKKYKFANLQEVVVKYRENDGSATFTKLRTIELKTISIRLRYSDGIFYKMSKADHLYNIAQYISIFLPLGRAKIFLFNLLRNSR